ncbi:MAG: type II toxin-antitoxin system HicA family toxin [Cryomorphaceae bacterium]|nr:type II toxin-antitoxin system HicA family toxin [Flavobacteriales bacterium]
MKSRQLFKLLHDHGWEEERKKGSHVILKNKDKDYKITVPYPGNKEVKKGLLQKILKQTGIETNKR